MNDRNLPAKNGKSLGTTVRQRTVMLSLLTHRDGFPFEMALEKDRHHAASRKGCLVSQSIVRIDK